MLVALKLYGVSDTLFLIVFIFIYVGADLPGRVANGVSSSQLSLP